MLMRISADQHITNLAGHFNYAPKLSFCRHQQKLWEARADGHTQFLLVLLITPLPFWIKSWNIRSDVYVCSAILNGRNPPTNPTVESIEIQLRDREGRATFTTTKLMFIPQIWSRIDNLVLDLRGISAHKFIIPTIIIQTLSKAAGQNAGTVL